MAMHPIAAAPNVAMTSCPEGSEKSRNSRTTGTTKHPASTMIMVNSMRDLPRVTGREVTRSTQNPRIDSAIAAAVALSRAGYVPDSRA